MHARRVKTKGSPERVAEAKDLLDGTVAPAVSAFPGFRGAYWLADRSTGEGIGYFFYETKEDLVASAGRAAQLRDGVVQQLDSELQGVDEFEVIVDTGKKIHHTATHARVAEFEGDPGGFDAAVKVLNEIVLPNARNLPGFEGGVWMYDRAAGKGVGITLYDSAEHLAASRAAAEAIRAQSNDQAPVRVKEFREFEILSRAHSAETASV